MRVEDSTSHLYDAWLRAKNFRARDGQLQMIRFIDAALRSRAPRVAVVEAGPGTGKTIAYSTSTVPFALEQNKRVVIVTATVALQDQITSKDLPELRVLPDVSFSYVLAKGRQRYVCPRRLSHAANSTDVQALTDLGGNGGDRSDYGIRYVELFDSLTSGSWSGDIDHSPVTLPQRHWSSITTDSRGCTGNSCNWYSKCPYFKTRQQFFDADVIVTNYDLLLTHLRLGTDILPAIEDSIFVLDEAHNLVPKTMNAFSKAFSVVAGGTRLNEISARLIEIASKFGGEEIFERTLGEFSEPYEYARSLLKRLINLIRRLDYGNGWEGVRQFRFVDGSIPEDIQAATAQLGKEYSDMGSAISRLCSWLRGHADAENSEFEKEAMTEYLNEFVTAEQHLEESRELFLDFGYVNEDGVSSRWVEHATNEAREEWRLKSVPVEINQILSEKVWNKAYAAVLTSATLDAGDDFLHFKTELGLEIDTKTLGLESPFDLERAVTLQIPRMQSTAGGRNSDQHSLEITELLPDLLGQEKSALVLFTSRVAMDLVYNGLSKRIQRNCLVQSQMGRHALLEMHKDRIDNGQNSYIFGLASYREGIDLPGDYCRHVIITKIPFDVPSDPIVESKQELMLKAGCEKSHLFTRYQVPEATLRLTQACGRLIRNEHDWGRITILDRRLVSRNYGEQMLRALPNYRLDIEN
ncbi:MAG: hypothetical protein OXG24_11980 [Gammaproteobacteria bacterium]|nr:hypothetical protein [Gammaproteobacteria bacterium]